MAIPSNRTPVRVARGAAVKFTETIDGVAGAGAKALEDGEIVWDETNEKFQLKVGGSSSTTLKDHTVDTSNLAALAGANFTGDVSIELDDYLHVGGSTLTTATLLGRTTDATNGGTYGELRQGANEDLYIQGAAGKKVAITSFTDSVYGPDSEIMAEFIDQGAVKLYYDQANHAAAKLETTSSGVAIAGNIVLEGATADAHETTLAVTDPTADRTITFPDATGTVALGVIGTDIQAHDADTAKLDVDQTWTGAQRGGLGTLSSSSNSTAVDLSVANNFNLTLGENSTLAQPSNQVAGQSGSIFVTQDTGGNFTLAYHADWKWAGGTAPTLSTAAGSVDRIDYIVAAANKIHAVVTLAVA